VAVLYNSDGLIFITILDLLEFPSQSVAILASYTIAADAVSFFGVYMKYADDRKFIAVYVFQILTR